MSNPKADAWMAVKALLIGLEGVEADLAADLAAFVSDNGLVGAKGKPPNFRTQFGTAVSYSRDDDIAWDAAAVLELAVAEYPHQVIPAWEETVVVPHPAAVHAAVYPVLLDRCVVSGEDVVDRSTGVVLGRVKPGRQWYSPRLTAEAKADAKAAVAGRLGEVVALVSGQPLPELEGRTDAATSEG